MSEEPTATKPSLWERWVWAMSEEATMKAIFDHVRNLGICAAVFAAAGWRLKDPQPGIEGYFHLAVAFVLWAFGGWLYFVNQAGALRKFMVAGLSANRRLLLSQAENLISVSIVLSLAGR